MCYTIFDVVSVVGILFFVRGQWDGKMEKGEEKRAGGLEFDACGEVELGGFVIDGEVVHAYAVTSVDAEEVEEVEAGTRREHVARGVAEVAIGKGEIEHGADIGAGGKELGGAPAGTDMDGEVETAVQPVFEGIADAGEELVAALEGVVPVGGKAVDDFGLDIDEPVDGDAVGEADVGIAEYAKGAPVVDVGTDGFDHIDGGGEVVGLEVQRGGLLFAGTDNLVDVLAKSSGAESHQKGEYDDAACVFHCRKVYCPGQGLCV